MSGTLIDDIDNPEWTADDFANAVGPEGLTDIELAAFSKTRGRPKSAAPKVHLTLRLSQDVVDGFKAGGRGWQSRMDEALALHLRTQSAIGAKD